MRMTTREEREYMIKALTKAMDDNAVSGIVRMTVDVVSMIIDMIQSGGEKLVGRSDNHAEGDAGRGDAESGAEPEGGR